MGSGRRQRQKNLPKKLKRIRTSLELSQGGMLEKLGVADEMDRTYISAYERGRIEPPLYLLEKYARVANICMEVLISDRHSLPDEIPAKTFYHPH